MIAFDAEARVSLPGTLATDCVRDALTSEPYGVAEQEIAVLEGASAG
jgi:hypothetical protein